MGIHINITQRLITLQNILFLNLLLFIELKTVGIIRKSQFTQNFIHDNSRMSPANETFHYFP